MNMTSSASTSDPSSSSLYGFVPTQPPPLGVLLDAIEANPVQQPATSLGPATFTSFFEPGTTTQPDLPPHMNISSLLAASQQIAVPQHHPSNSTMGHRAMAPPPPPPAQAHPSSSTPSTGSSSTLLPLSYDPVAVSMPNIPSSLSNMSMNPAPPKSVGSELSRPLSSNSTAALLGPTNLGSSPLPIQQAWATFHNALGAFQDSGRQVDFSSAAYSSPTVDQLLRQASNSPSTSALSAPPPSSASNGASGAAVSSANATPLLLPQQMSPTLTPAMPTTVASLSLHAPSLSPLMTQQLAASEFAASAPNVSSHLTPLSSNSTLASMTLAPPMATQMPRVEPSPIFANAGPLSRPPPPASTSATVSSSASSPRSAGKRKANSMSADERRAKVRRCIEEASSIPLAVNSARSPTATTPTASTLTSTSKTGGVSPTSVTTIMCLHASIGQKSYGNEKRFLNPPPMVRVVGPLHRISRHPRIAMEVVSDTGVRCSREQAAVVSTGGGGGQGNADPNARTYFRSLHIGKAGKAKTFRLEMSLHPSNDPPPPELPFHNGSVRKADAVDVVETLTDPLAAFSSSEMQIISKPSKKTAKARNTDSCLFAGSTIALFNRINAQTVRTKFAVTEEGRMSARAHQWTALSIQITKRAEETDPELKDTLVTSRVAGGAHTVTYGSEIVLTDLMTGTTSEPLIVRKVERGQVHLGASGPVAQLQKLALVRVTGEGESIYLSASLDGLNKDGKIDPDLNPNGKTTNFDNNNNGESPTTDDSGTGLTGRTYLTYQPPLKTLPPDDQDKNGYHVVTDYMTWTVVGIDSFSYSFFDAFATADSSSPTNSPNLAAITPFPLVQDEPTYEPTKNVVSLAVSDFEYASSTGKMMPLEVWLGPIGPLKTEIVKSGEPISSSPTTTTPAAKSNSSKKDTTATSSGLFPPNPLITREKSPAEISIELPLIETMLARGGRGAGTLGGLNPAAMTTMNDYAPLQRSLHPVGTSSVPLITPMSEQAVQQSVQALTAHLNSKTGAGGAEMSSTVEMIEGGGGNEVVSLPLIFVRASDGIGYQSGRWIVVEPAGLTAGAGAGTSARGGKRGKKSDAAAEDPSNWSIRIV